MFFLDPLYLIFFSLLLAFAIVYFSIPTIVNVAHLKNLFDEPGHRKSHSRSIPNLGGISIFASFVIATGLFSDITLSPEFVYLFIGLMVLFFIGLKDDILVIAPVKKLYGEIIASVIITIIGGLQFTSLHGFLGIREIGYLPGVILTVFVMIVIINSFNLIDGIDGLASGIGILITLTFGIWFYLIGNINYAVLCAALLGALVCFFGYNVYGARNKIFMGDTGSLIVGMIISVIVIKFNEISIDYSGPYRIHAAPAVSFGILIIPLFDTMRVFFIRIRRGLSPFSADKNHLHHRMLKLGLSHKSSTLMLLTLNLIFIVLVLIGQTLGIFNLMLMNIGMGIVFTLVTEYFIRKNKQLEFRHNHTRQHIRA